tara:strand:- start:1569 stop:1889 length:321 start_codon:yes stop_codon:yes gene_type:complete
MVKKLKSLLKLKPLVAGFLAVDGWCLQCNWINGPSGPPKILSGGKYMTRTGGGVRSKFELTLTAGKYKTRKGGIKLALALIGRGGKAIVDWSRKEWIERNGIQLRG